MTDHAAEPNFDRPIEHSFCRFTRNSKGDTQVEIKVIAGEDPNEVHRIREIALDSYRKAVEATGGLIA